MRKFSGSALVDYAIPTLLIGIVAGLGFTYMHSNGLITNFMAASSNMKIDGSKAIVGNNPLSTSTTTSTTTSSTATPDSPVIVCVAGTCTIDFGDFKLNDVPEDFASYIASNGSSVGTDKLMELLEQLAIQLNDPATPEDEGAPFRIMAELGHFIARNEESLENDIKANGDLDMDRVNAIDVPASIASLLTGLSLDCSSSTATSGCSMADNYSKVMSNTFGDVLTTKTSMPAFYADSVKNNPMYAFYDKFEEVMNSPDYPDSAKKIAQEVLLSLDDITFNFQGQTSTLNNNLISPITHKDPITGDVIASGITYTLNDADLTNPQSSFYTDLDSAILCTAGKDIDTGVACHN